jgi:hypothetical protein
VPPFLSASVAGDAVPAHPFAIVVDAIFKTHEKTCQMNLEVYLRRKVALFTKHAKHQLPWLYAGVADGTNEKLCVSYQVGSERFVGTHIQFDCEGTSFGQNKPNDDGQTLQECLGKLLVGEIKRFESATESDPRAKGAHFHQYFFKERLSDGSLADKMSYIEFYSISPVEAESLLEAEQLETDVPEPREPENPKGKIGL